MGGIAVRFYGLPRPTYDVDFTVAIDRGRLAEFYALVRDMGYSVPIEYEAGRVDQVAGMPLVKAQRFVEGRGIPVDLFLAETPFQKQLLSRRRRERIDDLSVSVVSVEDLILLKLIAGRLRDYSDIGDILLVQGQLDEPYMREWAERLGVLERLEEVLKNPPTV